MTKSPSPSVDEVARAIDKHIDAAPVDGINAEGDYNLNVFNQQQSYVDGLKVARLAAMNALAASLVSPPKAGPLPEHLSPLPWKYVSSGSPSRRVPSDWIEDANGGIVVENVGHIDGPFIVAQANCAAPNHEARGDGVRVREVLLFASYCGADNPECSPSKPCPVCLGMSNVAAIAVGDSIEIVRQLAPEWNANDALSSPSRAALPPLGDGRAEIVEAARMARTRLMAFADAANAGEAQAGGRELSRKIWAAFAAFDALSLEQGEKP